MPKNSSLPTSLDISELCPRDVEDVMKDLRYIEILKKRNNIQDLCNGKKK